MKATKFKLHIPSLFTRSFTFVFSSWCWCFFVGIAYTICANENTRVYISRVKLFFFCMCCVCAQKPLEQRWSCCIHRYHLILISLVIPKFYLLESKFLFTYLTHFGSGGVCDCTSINSKMSPCKKKLNAKISQWLQYNGGKRAIFKIFL